MEYPNYDSVPQKIRDQMKYTGTLTGRDGLDITIRFDAASCEIEGSMIKLTNCILRMILVIQWPDASESTLSRCVVHGEFSTLRYHCTVRPIVKESEERTERRQIAEAQSGPEN